MTSFEKQGSTINHASFEDRMRENQNNQQPSRFGLSRRSTRDVEGEIVEVEGGHIVRSIGRKDRHSKVCTAKGPRDRRVRLSAHTAIQFYDVQDRLGYDRPSKAVDWLIKKAKTAIDKLAELPPWQPNSIVPTQEDNRQFIEGGSIDQPMVDEPPIDSGFGFFPPLDSDSIADTIQSFFPMSASASASTSSSSSSLHFQNYPPDLPSRTSSSQIQDLRLSLQSFQDPILHQPSSSAQQTLFSTSASPAFDAISMNWSDQQQQLPEMWRSMDVCIGGGGEFVFNSPALQPMFGQNPFFSQRGPLQSSNSPHVRAWIDSPIDTIDHHQTYTMHPSSISCIGFSGFRIPARIQSEEEHNDGFSNKPSSASRH